MSPSLRGARQGDAAMCEWHDTRAELLEKSGSNKTSTVLWTEGQRQQDKGTLRDEGSGGSMRQNLCTERTVNQLYGRGEMGQVGMSRRVPISRVGRTLVELVGIQGGGVILPTKPYCFGTGDCQRC